MANYKGPVKVITLKINGVDSKIMKFDEYGNEIFSQDCKTGYYIEREYDNHGNVVHRKDSGSMEHWMEYSEDNHLIHLKKNDGFEIFYTYANGKLIHEHNSIGYSLDITYDDNGNMLSRVYSDGAVEEYQYDQYGNTIYYKDINTRGKVTEYTEEYEYYDK